MWLPIVIFSQFANAVALFLDKFLLTKKMPRPAVITFWTSVGNLLALVLVFWDFTWFPGWYVLILSLISGALFTIALQFFYLAMKKGEASHVGPLVGAVVPVVTFIISYYWLNERLQVMQLMAIGLLVLGALLLSLETTKKKFGWHIGMLWAVIAGILFATSYVLLRGIYLEVSFSTGFVWSRLGAFFVALPLLLLPGMWQDLFPKNFSGQKQFGSLMILAINKICAALYFLGMNFAISLTSATIVNALAGLQYAILFVLILLVSKFSPRFLREHFTPAEIVRQILALFLLMLGLGILIIK